MPHVANAFINILGAVAVLTAHCQEDKLVLKPEELVNLIIEEQIKNEIPLAKKQQIDLNKNLSTGTNDLVYRHRLQPPVSKPSVYDSNVIEEAVDIPLENKKVWSRWGKWGFCSVTCGTGLIVRRRLCVTGRCAPGEMEEQRRLCAREPCQPTLTTITGESLDQD